MRKHPRENVCDYAKEDGKLMQIADTSTMEEGGEKVGDSEIDWTEPAKEGREGETESGIKKTREYHLI